MPPKAVPSPEDGEGRENQGGKEVEKLIKYCNKNNIDFLPNVGGGITIYCHHNQVKEVESYISRCNVKHDKIKNWYNWDYTTCCIPCFI